MELIRWSTLHEQRGRRGLARGLTIPAALAALFACWVAWRIREAGFDAGSTAWLAGALLAFIISFLRMPFHIYWRADAALLAQLPIEGGALFLAALHRCARDAIATTLVVAIGAAPLFDHSTELAIRHLALAGTLGVCAALLMPAVALFAATLVAESFAAVRYAAGVDPAKPPTPNTALLGALPGVVGTGVFGGVLATVDWLVGGEPVARPEVVYAILAGISVLAIVGMRGQAPRVMGTILRDVSALDRQHLATLEIRPPTGIERAIAKLVGDAALPYAKDARLMRRRYPMAFALGALAFLVLGIIGITRPADPLPWLVGTLGAATAYGLSVAGRLFRPPIELARLSASLPISERARTRAKRAWIAGWWLIFVAAPGVFAALRQPSPLEGLALVGGGTLLVLGASFRSAGTRAASGHHR